MQPNQRRGEDETTRSTGEQRVETPADTARRDGEEALSIHRWTDAELRQRARDKGIANADDLLRAELIERLGKG